MAEKEYIEREALHVAIEKAQKELESNDDKIWSRNKKYYKGLAWARAIITEQPAADVAEVRHGEWIKVADLCGIEVLKCSVCGREHPREATDFCCDCGAKIDEKSEGERSQTRDDTIMLLLEDVLDTLVEVGNGVTDEQLHEAADKLFKVRDIMQNKG